MRDWQPDDHGAGDRHLLLVDDEPSVRVNEMPTGDGGLWRYRRGSSAEAWWSRCANVRLAAGPLPQFYGGPLFFLVKPFPVAQLLTKVRHVLRPDLPVIL
jgi:hypothetical protein